MSKVILSGMQPSGVLHLGNYLGAIKTWQKLIAEQQDAEFYFMMVDLHSLTSLNNAKELSENIKRGIICYIACGIKPSSNVKIFRQSRISEHSELGWVLQTITPHGWLCRMTQFKDKTQGKEQEGINTGLFTYPTLMAADILLYNADIVPVGEDQKQHVELTRDVAIRFNNVYKSDLMKQPQPMITDFSRIMSLTDGRKKMSKSDPSDLSRILLTDCDDEIRKKIKKAKTDSIAQIYYDKENRPEVSNLINIAACILGKKREEIEAEVKDMNTGGFKDFLADIVINEISPIRQRIADLCSNDDVFKDIESGEEGVRVKAKEFMDKVKKVIGVL